MRAITKFLPVAAFACALTAFCSISSAGENDTANGERLLAFIGQKLQLSKQEKPKCDNCIIFDSHYVATYKVLEKVHGNFSDDVITFDVYDHYGIPAFSKFDNVLLFISRRDNGTWEHEKYQYYDLYRSTDGQWYGCGDPYRSVRDARRTVHARPVQFVEPVSYPLDDLDQAQIERFYPAEYFEVREGRAYCLLGTSVNDLFQAKKETVLTARRIFK
jgi:hypothetical protein